MGEVGDRVEGGAGFGERRGERKREEEGSILYYIRTK